MTKERTSNERFEIVGLTKAEVDRCMEVLCGGPMPWDRGYCFASSELFARPSRYGPEPSNEGRTPMSDPTALERAIDAALAKENSDARAALAKAEGR